MAALTGCTGDWVQGSGDGRQTPSGSASAQPTAPSPTDAAAPVTSEPAAQPGADGIPDGVTLPDEGGASESPELSDWATDETDSTEWLLDACRPTTYPTDAQRTDFRTVTQTGPELLDARQLAAFPDEAVATEAMAGFRRVLSACATGGDPAQGSAWTWVSTDVPGLGDDAFVAGSTTGGPTYSPSGDRLAVVRAGSLVFLAYTSGEYSTAELDGGAEAVQEVAREFVGSL